MSAVFEREQFGGFGEAQLAAGEAPAPSPGLQAHLETLPADGRLEVFGHISFHGDHQAEVCRIAMLNMLEDIHGRIPAA